MKKIAEDKGYHGIFIVDYVDDVCLLIKFKNLMNEPIFEVSGVYGTLHLLERREP